MTGQAVRGTVKLGPLDTSAGPMKVIPGWTEFSVDNNNFASADTFSVTFALSALPSDRDANWLSQQKQLRVELFAGVPSDPSSWTAAELTRRIVGTVDNVDIDPVAGTAHLSGRDFTQRLIDEKSTAKFQNKTASQIATELATKHGLTPVVTKTTTVVGKYYQIDREHMQNARTDWDLLCQIARTEQFVVYVRGEELHVEPRPSQSAAPYVITWTAPDSRTGYASSNVERIKFERALTVAKGVIVVVRSWNDADQAAYTATYPKKARTTASPGQAWSGPQTYYYSVPNLTQEKVEQLAQAKHAEITQHEMKVEFELPAAGNDTLDITSVVRIAGTGTPFDQLYFPDSLRRELSFTGGYTLTVSAKNHAPDSVEETQ
jgi:phage protein D